MSEKTKKWIRCAAIRAARTAAQAVLILTGTDMVNILSLNWKQIVGVAAGQAMISLLMSVAGLPEVKEE